VRPTALHIGLPAGCRVGIPEPFCERVTNGDVAGDPLNHFSIVPRTRAGFDPIAGAAPVATMEHDTPASPRPRSGSAARIEDAPLSELERAILAFERQWWKQAGAKQSAIRAEFHLSATRYYQLLNRLLDSSAALAAEPSVVSRLRRLRDGGQ